MEQSCSRCEFGTARHGTLCQLCYAVTSGQVPDYCVFCGESTVFGSGRFVNRVPADTDHVLADGTDEYLDGWMCPECEAEGSDDEDE